jgi:hypothetical protein
LNGASQVKDYKLSLLTKEDMENLNSNTESYLPYKRATTFYVLAEVDKNNFENYSYPPRPLAVVAL